MHTQRPRATAVQPVPPSPTIFLDGVATRDLVVNPNSGLSANTSLSPNPTTPNASPSSSISTVGASASSSLTGTSTTTFTSTSSLPLESSASPSTCGWPRSTACLPQSTTAFLNLEMIDKLLVLALPVGSTKEHPITCPMGLKAPSMEELLLPPFLVPVAKRDLMRDSQMEYVEQMKKSGKEVKMVFSPGVEHYFYLNKIAIETDPDTAAQTDALIAAKQRPGRWRRMWRRSLGERDW